MKCSNSGTWHRGIDIAEEDCESTFTVRVRCKRWHLFAIIPALAFVSLVANLSMIIRHGKEVVIDDVAAASIRKKSKVKGVPSQKQKSKKGRKGMKKGTPKAMKVKTVPPKESSLSPDATFSACLLIKDDNEILNEWLAYHYHVLKLRSLVVAVDPLSSQSPSQILNKWRLMTDMDIFEWEDSSYMPEHFLRDGIPPEKFMQKQSDFDQIMTSQALTEISIHRYRQRVFLASCMKKHRKEGNSWVIHIDTDEYVTPSKLFRQMNPKYVRLPPMEEPGSVLSLIQQVVSKTSNLVSYPCLSMLRVLFGSVEMSAIDRSKNVPAEFNATTFESLRWRYHALPHNMSYHGNPKVILDVSAIPENYFPKETVFSIHRPITQFCHKNHDLDFTSFRKQPIAVNHYLGSWERYSGRNDNRRSRTVYEKKANVKRGEDDGVRNWLAGFVESVGNSTASKLLGRQHLVQPSILNGQQHLVQPL